MMHNHNGDRGSGDTRTDQATLIKDAVQHIILLAPQKKGAIKKSELLKSMNGQPKDFKRTVAGIAGTLDDVFGLKLTGIVQGAGADNSWKECPLDTANHFMAVSKVPRVPLENLACRSDQKNDVKESAVHIILHSLYIANRDLDEEYIWRLLENSKLDEACPQRDDLRKFLKAELVDPMYAVRTEVKSTEELAYRYSWGIRSELECDKYELLKHIANTLQKPMASFKKHYDVLLKDKKYEKRMAADNSGQDTQNGNDATNSNEEDEDLPEIVLDEDIVEEEEEPEPVVRKSSRKNRT